MAASSNIAVCEAACSSPSTCFASNSAAYRVLTTNTTRQPT